MIKLVESTPAVATVEMRVDIGAAPPDGSFFSLDADANAPTEFSNGRRCAVRLTGSNELQIASLGGVVVSSASIDPLTGPVTLTGTFDRADGSGSCVLSDGSGEIASVSVPSGTWTDDTYRTTTATWSGGTGGNVIRLCGLTQTGG
ncbi:MAG: hypothetical protein KC656_35180 [Myxococcales bacterium]|nr:hypothetical protein [Myxococcales bacterium]